MRRLGFHGSPSTRAVNWFWIQAHSRNLRCRSTTIFPPTTLLLVLLSSILYIYFCLSCFNNCFCLFIISTSPHAPLWPSKLCFCLINFKLKFPPVTDKLFLCSLGPIHKKEKSFSQINLFESDLRACRLLSYIRIRCSWVRWLLQSNKWGWRMGKEERWSPQYQIWLMRQQSSMVGQFSRYRASTKMKTPVVVDESRTCNSIPCLMFTSVLSNSTILLYLGNTTI